MGKLQNALIPAFDPGPSLLTVLEEVNEKGFTIIVVNDGSSRESDDLFRMASEYAEVLSHDKNCGKRVALKTGLTYIQNHFHSDYVVVTMNANGQHTARDAEFLCNLAEERKGQLILGSRKLEKYAPIAEANPSYHGVLSFVDAAGPAAFVTYIRAILLRDTGATISPFNAFLLLQGVETLSLRLERHAENTKKVVEYLAGHPQVEKVNHPSLPEHIDDIIADLENGFSAVK